MASGPGWARPDSGLQSEDGVGLGKTGTQQLLPGSCVGGVCTAHRPGIQCEAPQDMARWNVLARHARCTDLYLKDGGLIPHGDASECASDRSIHEMFRCTGSWPVAGPRIFMASGPGWARPDSGLQSEDGVGLGKTGTQQLLPGSCVGGVCTAHRPGIQCEAPSWRGGMLARHSWFIRCATGSRSHDRRLG